MKIVVTYNLAGYFFKATCGSIAEAYDYIKQIVLKEGLPDRYKYLSEYIVVLANIETGITNEYEDIFIRVARAEGDNT